MQPPRKLTITMLSAVCILAITLSVFLGTLHMTLLDRTVTKGWLVESGVYRNNLLPQLIQLGANKPEDAEQQPNDPTAVPEQAIRDALARTFTGEYIQSQSETVIDNYYNWLEGTSPAFTFSIPLDQKRDTFIAELSRAAEPYVASLPLCTAELVASQTPCRPANMTPAAFSQQLVTENVTKSNAFDQPLTPKNAPDTSSTASKPLLVQIVPFIQPILTGLVLLALAAAITIVLITPASDRLLAIRQLAKRLFFSQIFALLLALAFLWIASANTFRLPSFDMPVIVSETLSAILRLALTSIAGTFALLSGIVCGISLATWLGVALWQRHTRSQIPVNQAAKATSANR